MIHSFWAYLNSDAFHTLGETVISIGGILTALGFIWAKIISPAWKALANSYRILRQVEELHPVIISMASQFSTNGGSSLRDCMNRVESISAAAAKDAAEAVVQAKEAVIRAETAVEVVKKLPCHTAQDCVTLSATLSAPR